jgi:hypothetical protein
VLGAQGMGDQLQQVVSRPDQVVVAQILTGEQAQHAIMVL